MDYKKIRLPLEISLGQQLYDVIQGNTINTIINMAEVEQIESQWKFILEGHSFKIDASLAPKLNKICEEVVATLEFTEAIDFYITNNNDINAFALERDNEEKSHIINLNSGLIERFTDDELKFVIGHEVGHLISGNAKITKLLQFVYPNLQTLPLLLQHKIGLWEKMSELTADRFGYLSSPNLNHVLSNFFKLSSGLSPERINFDPVAYQKENEKTLAYFKEHHAGNMASHPINPIRIKAIELFSESALGKSIIEKGESCDDPTLITAVDELSESLKLLSSSEMDVHRKHFIASAGIILATQDDEISPEEFEAIIDNLSNFSIFPKAFLQEISEADYTEIFQQSVSEIIKQNPGERYNLITYLIRLAIADKNINEKEIEFIFQFGDYVDLSKKEVAQLIAESIQKYYIPDIY